MNKKHQITLKVNKENWEVNVANNTTLLHVLREDLNLIGTKEGCDDGSCGACTVLINGAPALACLTLAVECNGFEISTIEGLNKEGSLDPMQQSFIEKDAVQCGFCTSGMIIGAKHLVDNNPNLTEGDVRERLSGHICRCTGYVKPIEAVMDATKKQLRQNYEGGKKEQYFRLEPLKLDNMS